MLSLVVKREKSTANMFLFFFLFSESCPTSESFKCWWILHEFTNINGLKHNVFWSNCIFNLKGDDAWQWLTRVSSSLYGDAQSVSVFQHTHQDGGGSQNRWGCLWRHRGKRKTSVTGPARRVWMLDGTRWLQSSQDHQTWRFLSLFSDLLPVFS